MFAEARMMPGDDADVRIGMDLVVGYFLDINCAMCREQSTWKMLIKHNYFVFWKLNNFKMTRPDVLEAGKYKKKLLKS